MYSIWDKQCGRYLCSGINSTTKEECINDGIDYLTSDWEQKEINKVKKYSLEEKEELLFGFELIIDKHTLKL